MTDDEATDAENHDDNDPEETGDPGGGRTFTPLTKTAGVVIVSVTVALVIGFAVPGILAPDEKMRYVPDFIVLLVQIKIFITTFNLLLLLVLARSYVRIYRDLPNKYTRSLIILSISLLLYAFTSNPLIQILLGLHPEPNIGAFAFLSDFFIGIAIVVLFYQSEA
ncbi:MAG: hypothetical protein SV253_03915 [Halobacteria archaeon]|nr:hypothetical protein [Halobacteria archaeon]